jgi:hypothetical protein
MVAVVSTSRARFENVVSSTTNFVVDDYVEDLSWSGSENDKKKQKIKKTYNGFGCSSSSFIISILIQFFVKRRANSS